MSFLVAGKMPVKMVGNKKLQDGVAEEFQALIVTSGSYVFLGIRNVNREF
jgi:hypothetical protein